ncbi:MAG: hypothetical protein RL670_701, partial [Actinomycetota bacterium]
MLDFGTFLLFENGQLNPYSESGEPKLLAADSFLVNEGRVR